MDKTQVDVRFNTRNDNDNALPWRVLLATARPGAPLGTA